MADERPARRIHDREEAGIEFSRVVAFSDGVFAIAITLLVLALQIPPHVDDLGAELRDRGDEFFAYGLSFAVLASMWLAHHRFYATVLRVDGTMIGLNLAYLAFVALVPFTSSLLGDYGDTDQAVIIYAAVMAAISLLFSAQIVYAFRRRLLREEMGAYERRLTGPAVLLPPAVFIATIPIALVEPSIPPYLWIALLVVGDRLAARISGQASPY